MIMRPTCVLVCAWTLGMCVACSACSMAAAMYIFRSCSRGCRARATSRPQWVAECWYDTGVLQDAAWSAHRPAAGELHSEAGAAGRSWPQPRTTGCWCHWPPYLCSLLIQLRQPADCNTGLASWLPGAVKGHQRIGCTTKVLAQFR